MKKQIIQIFLLIAFMMGGCLYGILICKKEIFPYHILKVIYTTKIKLTRLHENVAFSNMRICSCQSSKEIKFKRDDGLKIFGSLYGIKDKAKRPGIILLHGNTPLGRKLAIYKVLASKFASKGYLVLAIDRCGFGESDDPFRLNTKAALDADKDVIATLKYFKTILMLDLNKIYLIGHSGGSYPALSAGIKEESIKKIVLIGPPRRVEDRLRDPHDRENFWNRALRSRQEIYKKPFPRWFTEAVWLNRIMSNTLEKHVHYFKTPNHKPIMLIDGALEDQKDKKYLRNYYLRISEPKEYITIPNSNHYLNTSEILGLVVYDKDAVNIAVDKIDQWLKMSNSSS